MYVREGRAPSQAGKEKGDGTNSIAPGFLASMSLYGKVSKVTIA